MNEMNAYEPQVITQKSVSTEMMVSRQAQEVQAAMVVAKKFPRDENVSETRIMNACKRRSLAEQATYEYPRGTETVTGPSIRLAEVIAQNWGNIDFGITELEQKNGESTVMAYCWDLETNTRQTKIFTVPHIRSTKNGSKALTDPRDIYELVANQGARRLRACILGIIPGDIVESAVLACRKTLSGGAKPLAERIEVCINLFLEQYGVPKESLEKYIGMNTNGWTEQTLVRLAAVNTSLKNGIADLTQFFELPDAAPMNVNLETGEVIEESTAPAAAAESELNFDDL